MNIKNYINIRISNVYYMICLILMALLSLCLITTIEGMCIIKLYDSTIHEDTPVVENRNVEMRKILLEDSTLNNKLWYEIKKIYYHYKDDDLTKLVGQINGIESSLNAVDGRIFYTLFPQSGDRLTSINNNLIAIYGILLDIDDYDDKYKIVISRLLYSISINYEDVLIYTIKNLVLSCEDEKRKSDLNNAILNVIGSDNKIYNNLTKVNIFVKDIVDKYITNRHIKEKHLDESILDNLKNIKKIYNYHFNNYF